MHGMSGTYVRYSQTKFMDLLRQTTLKISIWYRETFGRYCLLAMTENYTKVLMASAALFTDLSQMFHCIVHDVLIAYGVKGEPLNLLFSYLKNGKLKVSRNKTYTEWMYILSSRPQESIFDISAANYAENSNPYCTGLKISIVLIKLEHATETLLQWRLALTK